MNEYFKKLNKTNDQKYINEMRKYALENKVPIINDDGLLFLCQIARLTKAVNILEIGTAIGYSAINLALINENIHIDSIEKSEEMYQKALENISKAKLEKQINVILKDALEVDETKLLNNYDLIFIDAAKAQYIKFFEKYEKLLKKNGVIVSDNLLFHGLVTTKEKVESKNLRSLIAKIRDYNEWLAKNKKYHTVFLEIGDGLAVSEKL
jgi:predicted O-methyltransferase YrrM